MATIHVVLINAETQTLLGEADLPPDQLPETFAIETKLHLGDDDWQVEHAEPVTRAEAVAAGRIRLVIRRLLKVDPKTVLFSLPTLENALPPTQGGGDDAVRIDLDDWRQIEVIASTLEPEIAAEVAEIRAVYAERDGVGFRRLHVRERIPEPLRGTAIALEDIARGARRMVGFHDQPGVISGGFAFEVEDGAIYGREEGGRVVVLAAWSAEPDLLVEIARAHGLIVVDWCAAMVIHP